MTPDQKLMDGCTRIVDGPTAEKIGMWSRCVEGCERVEFGFLAVEAIVQFRFRLGPWGSDPAEFEEGQFVRAEIDRCCPWVFAPRLPVVLATLPMSARRALLAACGSISARGCGYVSSPFATLVSQRKLFGGAAIRDLRSDFRLGQPAATPATWCRSM